MDRNGRSSVVIFGFFIPAPVTDCVSLKSSMYDSCRAHNVPETNPEIDDYACPQYEF